MVLSTATVIFVSVDSWLPNLEVRNKVADAILVAETAKESIVRTCAANRTLTRLTNKHISHTFPFSPYVRSINVMGSCRAPEILVQTKNTGLDENPTLVIWGRLTSTRDYWQCSSSAASVDTPIRCRDEKQQARVLASN